MHLLVTSFTLFYCIGSSLSGKPTDQPTKAKYCEVLFEVSYGFCISQNCLYRVGV